MGRQKMKSSIRRDKEEEEENEVKKPRVKRDDDDDDEEANEDLSLRIVEKAMLQKHKEAESALDEGASTVEVFVTYRDGVKVVKKVIRKVKKVKKKKNKSDEAEAKVDVVLSGKDDGFENFCSDLCQAEEIKVEEKIESVEAVEIVDNAVQTSPDDISDNHVLRKLLRGPRYFDPPENGWGTCYNCGEEGHTTVNCTAARRKKPCFVCGSFEHNAKQCSKSKGDCFICKKAGHHAKDCPEKNGGGSQNSKFCLKCGESGHDMFSCRSNYCPDDLKETQCYVCGEFGHLCCKSYPDTGPREVSCYKCGSSGHTGLACARTRGEAPGSGSVSSCFRCGEEGHFARECSKSVKGAKRDNEPSTPKQRSSKKSKKNDMEVTPGTRDSVKGRSKGKVDHEGRFTSSSKPKQWHRRTTQHPGEYRRNNGNSVGWRSPATPYNYRNSYSASGHATNFYSSPATPFNNGNYNSASAHSSTPYSRYPQNPNFSNTSSNGSALFYQHGYSPSPFSNYSNGGNYNWY